MASVNVPPVPPIRRAAPPPDLPPPPVDPGRECPSCGGLVDRNDKFCGHCGEPTGADATKSGKDDAPTARYIACQTCGSKIAVSTESRSYVCPFCDSNYVAEFSPEFSTRTRPEFVLGFGISPTDAMELFRGWIKKNSWFRPSDLAISRAEDKLKGVYLPFWSFSCLALSDWSAQIGEYWYRTETYTTVENGKTVVKTRTVTETEWWSLRGKFHQFQSGYLVSGSKGLPQEISSQIMPFQLAALKRFEPYFLAGWMSEEYSVEREKAWQASEEEFHNRQIKDIDAFLPGDTNSGLRVHTRFEQLNSDLILLPIYLLSYRYRDKVYRWVLNGQTGRMTGQKPLAWGRIWTLVIAVIVVLALIILAVVLSQQTQR